LVGLYREYKGYLDVLKHEGAMSSRAYPVSWKINARKIFHTLCGPIDTTYFYALPRAVSNYAMGSVSPW